MKNRYAHARLVPFRTILFLAAILTYLISFIGNAEALTPVLSFLSLGAILLSIPDCSWFARCLVILFVGAGNGMMVAGGVDFLTSLHAYGGMMNLLSLFALIPLLALPIKLGGYTDALERIMQEKMRSPQQLYRTISGLSFFLSIFLNLATLPMIYYNVKETIGKFPLRDPTRFATLSIVHGYAFPIFWTPVAPIVGVVLDVTHLDWLKMFPLLFGISICCLMLDWGLASLFIRRTAGQNGNGLAARVYSEMSATTEPVREDVGRDLAKLAQIGVAITLFIILLVLLNRLFSFGLIANVVLLTFPFSAAWALLAGKGRPFFRETAEHFATHLPKMAEQFAIFLSAGFFVNAMLSTDFHHNLNEFVLSLKHVIGVHAFIMLLPLIPLGLAYLGMHPVVAITLLAQSLNPSSLNVSPEVLAVALLGGAVSTFIMGPFNGTLGVFSGIVKENPFRLSGWSWPYTACYLVMLVLALWLLL